MVIDDAAKALSGAAVVINATSVGLATDAALDRALTVRTATAKGHAPCTTPITTSMMS